MTRNIYSCSRCIQNAKAVYACDRVAFFSYAGYIALKVMRLRADACRSKKTGNVKRTVAADTEYFALVVAVAGTSVFEQILQQYGVFN
jgi:hypothetical protein